MHARLLGMATCLYVRRKVVQQVLVALCTGGVRHNPLRIDCHGHGLLHLVQLSQDAGQIGQQACSRHQQETRPLQAPALKSAVDGARSVGKFIEPMLCCPARLLKFWPSKSNSGAHGNAAGAMCPLIGEGQEEQ